MTGPLIERLARGSGAACRLRCASAPLPVPQLWDGERCSRARPSPGSCRAERRARRCWRSAARRPSRQQERLGAPERRTLVYRGRQVVPKRERRFLWILSSVSDWELDEQEVEITLERGIVQDVQVRVRRARLPTPAFSIYGPRPLARPSRGPDAAAAASRRPGLDGQVSMAKSEARARRLPVSRASPGHTLPAATCPLSVTCAAHAGRTC